MQKLCLIFNAAPHYREAVFRMIDAEYNCDWYFGETKSDIKEMDTSLLKSVKYYKTLGNPSKMYWKRGILRLLFKKEYNNFFMQAESRSLTDYLFLLLASCFFPKKKIYIWTHGWYGKEYGVDAKLKMWQFRHVSGMFVYGDRAKKLLTERGISEKKLFAIHNSLDYDTQKALRENLKSSDIYKSHFNNEQKTIIFIGRLTKVKKLDMIVDALAALRDKGEKYNLVFVGNGEEAEALKSKVKALDMDGQVWFYGACYDEGKNAELVYNADLCVSPGNVGLTAIHCLTFGCPIITHNCFEWQMPEYEAISTGVTGDFFKKDDISDLANKISGWFAKKHNQRENIRQACFKEIDTNWNPYYQMEVIRKNLKLI